MEGGQEISTTTPTIEMRFEILGEEEEDHGIVVSDVTMFYYRRGGGKRDRHAARYISSVFQLSVLLAG